jgi:hypothetical protein
MSDVRAAFDPFVAVRRRHLPSRLGRSMIVIRKTDYFDGVSLAGVGTRGGPPLDTATIAARSRRPAIR